MKRTTLLVSAKGGQSEEGILDELTGAGQAQWAQEEFGQAPLPDRRLVKRLILMASDFAQHPTAPIPQACGCWGKTKAAYRFFDNETVQPQAILEAHQQATVQRLQGHAVILCVQDTTTLNYSTHPRSQGLGPIGNNRDKTVGLLLHTTLALTSTGQPLGVLQAQSWARSRRTFGRSSQCPQPYSARPEGEPEVDGQFAGLPVLGVPLRVHHAGQRGRPRRRPLRPVPTSLGP